MDLTLLRYFMNVASVESFSKGARLSHVSPPAISKAIVKLEEELGTQLFTRTTRTVALTEAGLILRARCVRIFEELAGVRRDLEETQHAITGELRIGAMEVFSIHLLPMALGRIVRSHPKVVPHCHELVPQEMERLVADGRLDVGFTIGAGAVKGVDYHSVGRSPGVLVCGRGHPLHARGRIDAAALRRYPFVAPQVLGMEHLPVLDQFPEAKHVRTIGATIELLQMGVQLAIEGAYLGFFPEICVRDHLAKRRLRALGGIRPGVTFDLLGLTRAGARPKRAAQLLLKEVRDVVSVPL